MPLSRETDRKIQRQEKRKQSYRKADHVSITVPYENKEEQKPS